MNKIIQWWMTPKFPKVHITTGRLSVIKKWFIHPIKRRFAKYYLAILRKYTRLVVIGITGSVGKTTTKEMITSILKLKGETVSTFENIDPIFNIPSTILKCRITTKFLVLEMGVEYPEEMDFYLWLSKPDVGVLTNVYKTHTLYFGDIGSVAKEKAKLISSLPKNGIAVLNKDNLYTRKIDLNAKPKVIWFGIEGIVKADKIMTTKDYNTSFRLIVEKEEIDIVLPIVGNHFVSNALAAAAVGHSLNIDIRMLKKGLETYSKPLHRMNVIWLSSGALLLDDSYNNNPQAASEAIKTFVGIAGKRRKIIVFGDMLELGRFEEGAHREIGRIVSGIDLEFLIAVGKASKYVVEEAQKKVVKEKIKWFPTYKGVVTELKPFLKKGNAILVKGSRSINLDRVVSELS